MSAACDSMPTLGFSKTCVALSPGSSPGGSFVVSMWAIPATVDALHHGGIAQGIGAVFYEEFTYSEAGQLLANNLWDYGIPTTRDVARIHSVRQETPSPWMPMGAKGAAEGGYIATPAALLVAVNDALEPFGTRIDEVPITPERVLAAIEAARS